VCSLFIAQLPVLSGSLIHSAFRLSNFLLFLSFPSSSFHFFIPALLSVFLCFYLNLHLDYFFCLLCLLFPCLSFSTNSLFILFNSLPFTFLSASSCYISPVPLYHKLSARSASSCYISPVPLYHKLSDRSASSCYISPVPLYHKLSASSRALPDAENVTKYRV
jgi:hypothetical protein